MNVRFPLCTTDLSALTTLNIYAHLHCHFWSINQDILCVCGFPHTSGMDCHLLNVFHCVMGPTGRPESVRYGETETWLLTMQPIRWECEGTQKMLKFLFAVGMSICTVSYGSNFSGNTPIYLFATFFSLRLPLGDIVVSLLGWEDKICLSRRKQPIVGVVPSWPDQVRHMWHSSFNKPRAEQHFNCFPSYWRLLR